MATLYFNILALHRKRPEHGSSPTRFPTGEADPALITEEEMMKFGETAKGEG